MMRWHSLICPFKPARLFFYFLWPVQDFEDGQACSDGPLSVGIGVLIFGHGEKKKKQSCHPSIGPFKWHAHFFLFFWSFILFSYIIIHCLYYYNKKNNALQWQPR